MWSSSTEASASAAFDAAVSAFASTSPNEVAALAQLAQGMNFTVAVPASGTTEFLEWTVGVVLGGLL